MRVITGKYRNKKLFSVEGSMTRPTSDKVRESMFDVISSRYIIENADVLDLFCGTGALGIEALSRGAATCVFVDKNPAAIAVARRNISFVNENTSVYNTDWKVAVRKLAGKKFDLIFVDPPYTGKVEREVALQIIENDMLSDDGCIVIEHDSSNVLDFSDTNFDVYEKKYSTTSVTYLSLRTDGEN